jgi:hypothetical protein
MHTTEARRKAVSSEELASALFTITDFLQHSSTTGGGRRLRQFVWSLWNESHLINLFDLCHGLDGPLTDAVVIVFHAALVGVLSEEHLRKLLIESGEMARWNSAQRQTPPAPRRVLSSLFVCSFSQGFSGGRPALRTERTMTPAQHAANQRIMLNAIEREYQKLLETGSLYSQDKAMLDAIQEEQFTQPLNADDWDAYIYDLAFSIEAKLGIKPPTHA